MKLSRLLATTNVSLTTAAAAVTAPTSLTAKVTGIVVGAVSGGAFVAWLRQAASDSTYSATCLASKEYIDLTCSAGATVFYGKLASGTATLEVEWWG